MFWLAHRYNLPNEPVPLGVVVPIPTSEMLCSVCPFTILVYAIIRGVGACVKGTDSRDVRAGWRVGELLMGHASGGKLCKLTGKLECG